MDDKLWLYPWICWLINKKKKWKHWLILFFFFELLMFWHGLIEYLYVFTWLQNTKSGSLGDFVVDWDSLQSQDVILQRKCETGEEVVVSALLGRLNFRKECTVPREVLMKVCLKRPGLSSILQFDCEISEKGNDGSEFDIHNAYLFQSSADISPSAYRGPLFR